MKTDSPIHDLYSQRIPAPSPEVREQVLQASYTAWASSTKDEDSWVFPLLRLAASVLFALGLILFMPKLHRPPARWAAFDKVKPVEEVNTVSGIANRFSPGDLTWPPLQKGLKQRALETEQQQIFELLDFLLGERG